MAVYVDGYLLPVPKKNVAKYRKMATLASKVWKDHGALEYRECLADDVKPKGMPSFLKAVKAKKGETVFFSYIVYKSRAHRDQVNKKVMKDPRLAAMMDGSIPAPFDYKRMYFGGFKALVEA
jgi:uncharacterized protein YbaA (DUF1428 family)